MRILAAILLGTGVVLGAAGAYAASGTLSAWGFGLGVAAVVVWLMRAAREDGSSGSADGGILSDLGSDSPADSGGGGDGGGGSGDS